MMTPPPIVTPVVCALVTHHTEPDFVLALRRRPDAEFGGQWCFPGGKIEPGDAGHGNSPRVKAVERELREEVGFERIAFGDITPIFSTTFAPPVTRATVAIEYFHVTGFAPLPRAVEPGTEVAWFAWRTLGQHDITPGTRALLDHLGPDWLDRTRAAERLDRERRSFRRCCRLSCFWYDNPCARGSPGQKMPHPP